MAENTTKTESKGTDITAAPDASALAAPIIKSGKKKKGKIKIAKGRVYINSTYDNTIVTVTDISGNTITRESAYFYPIKIARSI